AGAEVLGQEWPERLIFPSLNVARTPVVHQHDSKNVIFRAIDWDGRAQAVSRPYQKGGLEYEIEAARRTKSRRRTLGRFCLASRPFHFGAADHDRAGTAMVGDRQPFPVRHERVFRPTQHRPDVMGMMIGRIKIGVISNARRREHRYLVLLVENAIA